MGTDSWRTRARKMNVCLALLCLLLATLCAPARAGIEASLDFSSSFRQNFVSYWSPWQIQASDTSNSVQISLTQGGGAGFSSTNGYLYGKFEARIKTVPGNSAGTCFSFYLTSIGPNHDEIDIEWLGNVTGQPTILQTNFYSNGTGGREVRHFLWFDPSADYHTYTILWNSHQILWEVDGVIVRQFKDATKLGVAYPNAKPQIISSSIYDAGDWATRGGLDKVNYAAAPFTASFQGITADACHWEGATSGSPGPFPACAQQGSGSWWDGVQYRDLSDAQLGQIRWAKHTWGVYDYCDDRVRYPTKSPECTLLDY